MSAASAVIWIIAILIVAAIAWRSLGPVEGVAGAGKFAGHQTPMMFPKSLQCGALNPTPATCNGSRHFQRQPMPRSATRPGQVWAMPLLDSPSATHPRSPARSVLTVNREHMAGRAAGQRCSGPSRCLRREGDAAVGASTTTTRCVIPAASCRPLRPVTSWPATHSGWVQRPRSTLRA